MNTDVEIKQSPIDRVGVFAKKDFNAGDVVLVWDTSHVIEDINRLSEAENDALARYKNTWILMQEPMRSVNHSCEPNTRSDDGKDVAIRYIPAGEEITTDYRAEMKTGERMECRCGTPSCKGYILGTAA
jgi:hypothetical protein